MKKILTLGAVAMLALATGCSNKKKDTAASNTGVLTPPPAPPVMPSTYSPAVSEPMTVTKVTPEVSEPMTSASASGRKYVVKKGDTLWSIAARTYGDGKQHTRIATANNIKNNQIAVGQTIVLP